MKKILTLLTIVLSLVLINHSCKPDPEEELGSIYGIVTDKATGEPVKSANVQLRPSGETSLTGNDGRYEFLDLKNGNYSITVSKTGYTDLVDDYVITVEGSKAMRRDVQIEKLPAELRIMDGEGNDITELDFGSMHDDNTRMFNIFNDGTTALEYEIIKTASWINSINPQQGSLKPGATKPVVIIIDREKMSMGNNTTSISITTNDGGKLLTIKANKAGDVSTFDALEITTNSALLCGSINVNTTYTEKGFFYGDSHSVENKQIVSGYSIGEFSFRLTNLESKKSYYYRAYMLKVDGETVLGDLVSFTTLGNDDNNGNDNGNDDGNDDNNNEVEKPTVTTIAVTEITQNTAVCGGNVTSDGGAAVTARGVCWSTSQNPTINSNKTNDGSGTGSFTSNITGLNHNTTYYVRAYATNSEGTSYGEVKSFTTEDKPSTGVINGHEYVDLGLPSGTKWATCNVGANSPEMPGGYYAWGELETKDYYGNDNCSTHNVEMEDISGDPVYDVARKEWGSTWRMPKMIEANELFSNCSKETIEINGRKCTKLTSYINGNSIILPCTGWITNTTNGYYNVYGRYWTSTPYYYDNYNAHHYTDSNSYSGNYNARYCGLSIRPVSE